MKSKRDKCERQPGVVWVDDVDVTIPGMWDFFARQYTRRFRCQADAAEVASSLDCCEDVYLTAAMWTSTFVMKIWKDRSKLFEILADHNGFNELSQTSPAHNLWARYRDEVLGDRDPEWKSQFRKVFCFGANVVLTKLAQQAQNIDLIALALDSLNNELTAASARVKQRRPAAVERAE